MKTTYVLGFLFDPGKLFVALIRKAKPEWQKGLLNGIGGKIEETDITSHAAMVREFREETGADVDSWFRYARMEGDNWAVECFCATGDLERLYSKTKEEVELHRVAEISTLNGLVENLPWLIFLALDSMQDGRPGFTIAQYP